MSTHRYSVIIPNNKEFLLKSVFISHAKYGSDWVSLIHSHPFTEIFYVISGKGSFITNNKQFKVKKNDVIIINPNIEHTEVSSTSEPLEYVAIGVSEISFTSNDMVHKNTPFSFLNFNDKQEEILAYLNTIMQETKKQAHNFENICYHLLNVLFFKLQREFNLKLEVNKQSTIGKEVSLAKEFINHNFKENITLNQLAKIVHLNKFYFSRIFKSEVGNTPIEFLNRRRIEEAKTLLKTTDFTISQISTIIGFTSQSYFSEVFNKFMHQTPSKYRE